MELKIDILMLFCKTSNIIFILFLEKFLYCFTFIFSLHCLSFKKIESNFCPLEIRQMSIVTLVTNDYTHIRQHTQIRPIYFSYKMTSNNSYQNIDPDTANDMRVTLEKETQAAIIAKNNFPYLSVGSNYGDRHFEQARFFHYLNAANEYADSITDPDNIDCKHDYNNAEVLHTKDYFDARDGNTMLYMVVGVVKYKTQDFRLFGSLDRATSYAHKITQFTIEHDDQYDFAKIMLITSAGKMIAVNNYIPMVYIGE